MANKILISVIMPVFNTKSAFLEEAVQSILSQTFKNFELIIVDDGSTIELYNKPIFNDERIVLLKNSKNIGISASRNIGIHAAKGEYISFMDSDDVAEKTKLEKQFKFLKENKNFIACSCWYKMFFNVDRAIHINLDNFEEYRCNLFFKHSPSILPSTFMVRTKECKKVLFDSELKYAEDWKFFVIISELGKFYMIKEELLFYRVSDCNLTSQHSTKINNQKPILSTSSSIGARDYIKAKLHLSLSEKANEALYLTNYAKTIWPFTFKSALKKIIKHNNIYNYYDKTALDNISKNKWTIYIKMINNPIKLFVGLITCPFSGILIIKFKQFCHKLLNYEN